MAGIFGAGVGEIDLHLAVETAGIGAEDKNAVGEKNSLGDGVGDEEGGPGLLLADGEEFLVEVVTGHLIERAERLVKEEDFWGDGKGARDRDAHFLPAGELAWVVGFAAVEAHEGEALAGDDLAVDGFATGEAEGDLDVFLGGEPREEGGFLEDEGELLGSVGGVDAIDGGGAARNRAEAGDEFKDGGLAAAAGADERDEVAALRVERDVVEDERTVAVTFSYVAESNDGRLGRHAGGCLGRDAGKKETGRTVRIVVNDLEGARKGGEREEA